MNVGQGATSGRLEAVQVRAMFDRIAGVYDLMNTAMTAGLHHRWRARAADLARVGPGSRALDVATGTGDLAIALPRRVAPGARARQGAAGALSARRRAGPSLRGRALRRRHRRLRGAQLRGPRSWSGRD